LSFFLFGKQILHFLRGYLLYPAMPARAWRENWLSPVSFLLSPDDAHPAAIGKIFSVFVLAGDNHHVIDDRRFFVVNAGFEIFVGDPVIRRRQSATRKLE